MTTLDDWMKRATRGLSAEAKGRVRGEIEQHFEAAREAGLRDGANPELAAAHALEALGDPGVTNCAYRKTMLTSSEARLLSASNCEARAIASRPLWRAILLAMPVALLAVAALTRNAALAAGGVALTIVLAGPFLPIYTPARSRIYRVVKWVTLASALVIAASPALLLPCLWPLVWVETTRVMIRRKLPVAQWPKQLYL